jgi:hypothetical protein
MVCEDTDHGDKFSFSKLFNLSVPGTDRNDFNFFIIVPVWNEDERERRLYRRDN